MCCILVYDSCNSCFGIQRAPFVPTALPPPVRTRWAKPAPTVNSSAAVTAITPPPQHRGYSEEKRLEAIQLYVDGTNFRRFARQLGVHHQTVINGTIAHYRALQEAGQVPPLPHEAAETVSQSRVDTPSAAHYYSDGLAKYANLYGHEGVYQAFQDKSQTFSVAGDNAQLRHYLAPPTLAGGPGPSKPLLLPARQSLASRR